MRPATTLTRAQAKRFYDRFGSRQDWQRFYEDRATTDLIRHGRFAEAQAVFEFGCGTGRFAQTLLQHHLPPDASYLGVDISSTMVGLARRRLAPFGDRAAVRLTDGSPTVAAEPNTFDRFITTYVLDLLSDDDIQRVVAEAHRTLRPEGALGVVSLTHGATTEARIVERAWMALHRRRPALVGGCRPIALEDYLDPARWRVRHDTAITQLAITSQVVVADRVGA